MLPDEYEPLMLVVVLRSFSSQVDANGIPPAADVYRIAKRA